MKFTYDGYDYDIILTKKHNKNLYIRVNTDLKINVTYPFYYTKILLKKIINDNRSTIIKMIEKQKKRSSKEEENTYLGKKYDFNNEIKDQNDLDNWYKKEAKKVFLERLNIIYDKFSEQIPYPSLKIRKMKTRWGVCNRKNNSVTLNLDLIKKDIVFIDYVIVHELSHFVHFDHSKNFWQTVSKYCPNYKVIRKELNNGNNVCE